MQKRFDDVIFI